MARFEMELPNELMENFKLLEKDSEEILGKMTEAGAEAVWHNVKLFAPEPLKKYARISKTYKTPTDGGINTKIYLSGYIPFSNPNRKLFTRKAKEGYVYSTDKGVPVPFLANIYEYGRSNAPFPKHPFFRKSFKKNQIEQAMLDAQSLAWQDAGITPFD